MKQLTLLLLGLMFTISVHADSFSKANTAYRAGNYQLAIEQYQKVLQTGEESAVIYYNLGNCYYRTGKIGKAILYYERANILSPSDEDIQHNLAVAKSHTVDKIDVTPKLFIFSWFENASSLFSSSGWMMILIILSIVIALIGIVFALYQNLQVRRYLAVIFIVSVTMLMLCSVLMYSRYHFESDHDYAVVTVLTATIKNGPNTTSNDAFIIHEGTKIKIEDRVDDWLKIRLEDGKVGWAFKNDLEII